MNPELPSYPLTNETQPGYQSAPAAQSAPEYISNPFKISLLALKETLEWNWMSVLTIVPRVLQRLLIILAVLLVVGLLTLFVHQFALLAIPLVLLAYVYIILLSIGARTVVQSASQQGTTVTGKEAVKAFGKRKLLSLALSSIVAGLVIIVGLILLVVPGLILLARLSLIPYAIYNEDLRALDAFKRSWNLTRGHVWEILGIHGAQLLAIGASGSLLAVTGAASGLAKSYKQLTTYEKANLPTGPTHKANYIVVIILAIGLPLYLGFAVFASIQSEQQRQDTKKRQECALTTTYSQECDNAFKGTQFELKTPTTQNDYTNDAGGTLSQ